MWNGEWELKFYISLCGANGPPSHVTYYKSMYQVRTGHLGSRRKEIRRHCQMPAIPLSSSCLPVTYVFRRIWTSHSNFTFSRIFPAFEAHPLASPLEIGALHLTSWDAGETSCGHQYNSLPIIDGEIYTVECTQDRVYIRSDHGRDIHTEGVYT